MPISTEVAHKATFIGSKSSPSELFQVFHMSSTLMYRSARWKLLCLALGSWYFRSSLRNWSLFVFLSVKSGQYTINNTLRLSVFVSPRLSPSCPPSRQRRHPSVCGCCGLPQNSAGSSHPCRAAGLSHTDLQHRGKKIIMCACKTTFSVLKMSHCSR